MLISVEKAESVFKPWWDTIYKQTLYAGIGLCEIICKLLRKNVIPRAFCSFQASCCT